MNKILIDNIIRNYPFLIKIGAAKHFVFQQNLSSAYFKERPDTTRAQLPIREEFDEIKKSEIPFIFLGYDQQNDVLVCWNYHNVKARLNEKRSVSFYSRQFFQDEVSLGTFLRKSLKNGDEPILFKRRDLVEFFNQIDTFFPLSNDEVQPPEKTDNEQFVTNGKLLKITDKELIEHLKPLIETKRTLQALKVVGDFYKGQFPTMKLVDWNKLIKEIFINKD